MHIPLPCGLSSLNVVRVVPGTASYLSVSSLSHRRVNRSRVTLACFRLLFFKYFARFSFTLPYLYVVYTCTYYTSNTESEWKTAVACSTAVGCCCGTIIIPNGCLAPNPTAAAVHTFKFVWKFMRG